MNQENISTIRKIQNEYLRLLRSHFKSELEEFQKSKLSINEFLQRKTKDLGPDLLITSPKTPVSQLEHKTAALVDEIKLFWIKNGDALAHATQQLGLFGIGLWTEMGIDEMVPKYGLYFDTLFVPDPFLTYSDAHFREGAPAIAKAQALGFLIVALSVSEAAEANTQLPMLIYYPQLYGHSDLKRKETLKGLYTQADIFAAEVLKVSFNITENLGSIDEIVQYLLKVEPPKLNQIMNIRFLMDFIGPFVGSIDNYPLSKTRGFGELAQKITLRKLEKPDVFKITQIIQSFFYMLGAREANSAHFGFEPNVSSFFWKANLFKNDVLKNYWIKNSKITEEDLLSYSFERKFPWLSNLSITDCIKLREDGVLEEIRDVFRIEKSNLKSVKIEDFESASRNFEEKVSAVIENYSEETKRKAEEIKRKLKLTYLSFGATVGLGVASLAFPAISALAIGTTAFGMAMGTASIKDVVNEHLTGSKIKNELGQRPISLLLKAYNENKKR